MRAAAAVDPPADVSAWLREQNAHFRVRERRDQLRHPSYAKPELLATQPNQVWSWDITKLKGPIKWSYFYLFVVLDIFGHYVVGWMVAHGEGARLAERLIEETCAKQNISPARSGSSSACCRCRWAPGRGSRPDAGRRCRTS